MEVKEIENREPKVSIVDVNIKRHPILYHYTNMDALKSGIISSSREAGKEICLWSTNCQHLNDPKELQPDVKSISETLFANILGETKLNELSEGMKIDFETYCTEVLPKSFILSFSLNEDYLPMWTMYGKNGSGIVLGFDTEALVSSNKLIHCAYENDELYSSIVTPIPKENSEDAFLALPFYFKKEVSPILRKIRNKEQPTQKEIIALCLRMCPVSFFQDLTPSLQAFEKLFIVLMAYKHNAYDYEKEVRELVNNDKEPVKYRDRNGISIPYIERFFSKSVLKSITIGPAADIDSLEISLRQFLDENGLSHVEIKKSMVPYRT